MRSKLLKPKTDTGLWIQDQFWACVEGQVVVLEDKKNRPQVKSQSAAAAQAHSLTAPMPGRITKVLAQEGQLVVMMEAMKMEYSLRMPVTGIVKRIHVQAGDQVSLGQTLVEW
jgi:biotin carboxyl carrier protein